MLPRIHVRKDAFSQTYTAPPEGPVVYKGTDVSPDPDANGDTLDLHREIAAKLARIDFKPQQRLNHFQWLNRPDLAVTGWHGWIQQTTRRNNGWLVKVRVMPRLRVNGAPIALTRDHIIELYNTRTDNYVTSTQSILVTRIRAIFIGSEIPAAGTADFGQNVANDFGEPALPRPSLVPPRTPLPMG